MKCAGLDADGSAHLSKHHVPKVHKRTAIGEALVEEDVIEVSVAVAEGERLGKEPTEDLPLATEHERRPVQNRCIGLAEACRESLEARSLEVPPDVAHRAGEVARVRSPFERCALGVPPPAGVQAGERRHDARQRVHVVAARGA